MGVLAGFEAEEFDVCTMCHPICSGQPSCDVEMPCYTRLNDLSFTVQYRYDDECEVHRCRRLRKLKGRS